MGFESGRCEHEPIFGRGSWRIGCGSLDSPSRLVVMVLPALQPCTVGVTTAGFFLIDPGLSPSRESPDGRQRSLSPHWFDAALGALARASVPLWAGIEREIRMGWSVEQFDVGIEYAGSEMLSQIVALILINAPAQAAGSVPDQSPRFRARLAIESFGYRGVSLDDGPLR